MPSIRSSAYRIGWWEHAELLEHLVSRPDIWSKSDENPNLWLRTHVSQWAEDGSPVEEPALGLLFEKEATGTFNVRPVPISWSAEGCDSYLERLLVHWTGYGHRQRVILFFMNTLGLTPETAELMSLALEELDADPDGSPRQDPEDLGPVQESMVPDALPPILPKPKDPADLGTWPLLSGGWLKLKLMGGMLRVQISLRDRLSKGFGPLLEGYVRPLDGRTRDYAMSMLMDASSAAPEFVSVADVEDKNDASGASLDEQIAAMEAILKERESEIS